MVDLALPLVPDSANRLESIGRVREGNPLPLPAALQLAQTRADLRLQCGCGFPRVASAALRVDSPELKCLRRCI